MGTRELRAQWSGLWQRLGASGDPVPVYQDLVRRYSEQGRTYHNLRHVEHCLAELGAIPEADDVAFALWFHDAVYDFKAKDNEERSAVLAKRAAQAAALPIWFGAQVETLILATKHQSPPKSAKEMLIVDIDLAILGQDRDRFDEYERQIRLEYSWVPQEAFVKGRAEVLARFLQRTRIYSTEMFSSKYEAIARENLTRSIKALH